MKVYIVLSSNPYFIDCAYSNRIISLINGLVDFAVQIEVLVLNNSFSKNEIYDLSNVIVNPDIKFIYLNKNFNSSTISKKIKFYNVLFSNTFFSHKKIVDYLSDKEGIVWTEADLVGYQIAYKLKKENFSKLKIFLELNEFQDIYKYNKSNFLAKIIGFRTLCFFESYAIHCYDGIAYMTNTLLQYYSKPSNPLQKYIHLPMTVDLDRFKGTQTLLNNFHKPYIAYVGSMNNKKDGVDILIKAFSGVVQRFKDYKLYLIGPYNHDTSSHLQLINDLNLQSNVFWMDQYPKNQIPNIITNANILVLPRPSNKQSSGGFPTKLGEYLASGRPVCATRIGELDNYLEDGVSVFFAQPNDVISISNTLIKIIDNPTLANSVAKNGQNVAFNIFNSKFQCTRLYNFLISL